MTTDKGYEEFLFRMEEIEKNQKEIITALEEFNLIMHGSKRLGIAPLRDQVQELHAFYLNWAFTYSRAKWVAGALGVTNIGMIITWIAIAIGRTVP